MARDPVLALRLLLVALEFPADKDGVLQHAVVHHADTDVLRLILALPDAMFSSADELVHAAISTLGPHPAVF